MIQYYYLLVHLELIKHTSSFLNVSVGVRKHLLNRISRKCLCSSQCEGHDISFKSFSFQSGRVVLEETTPTRIEMFPVIGQMSDVSGDVSVQGMWS